MESRVLTPTKSNRSSKYKSEEEKKAAHVKSQQAYRQRKYNQQRQERITEEDAQRHIHSMPSIPGLAPATDPTYGLHLPTAVSIPTLQEPQGLPHPRQADRPGTTPPHHQPDEATLGSLEQTSVLAQAQYEVDDHGQAFSPQALEAFNNSSPISANLEQADADTKYVIDAVTEGLRALDVSPQEDEGSESEPELPPLRPSPGRKQNHIRSRHSLSTPTNLPAAPPPHPLPLLHRPPARKTRLPYQSNTLDGFLKKTAASGQQRPERRWTLSEPDFLASFPAYASRRNADRRAMPLSWAGNGIELWNLRERARHLEEVHTEELLAGIRLVINQAEVYSAVATIRTLQINPFHPTLLTQGEIEKIRAFRYLFVAVFSGEPDANKVGHWSLAVADLEARVVSLFDSAPGRGSGHAKEATEHLLQQLPQTDEPYTHACIPITEQRTAWPCGFIAIECARRALCFIEASQRLPREEDGFDWVATGSMGDEAALCREIDLLITGHLGDEAKRPPRRQAPDQSTTGRPPPRSSAPPPPTDDVAQLLLEEWLLPVCCGDSAHSQAHAKVISNALQSDDIHDRCHSVAHIARALQGCTDRQPLGLPVVLDPSCDLLSREPRSRILFAKATRAPSHGASQPMESLEIQRPTDFSPASRRAFEGRVNPKNPPPRLCMDTHHQPSQALVASGLGTSFDVDSMLAFPLSLRVARLGIQWYPVPQVLMNHTGNVHLSLPLPPSSHHPATEGPDPASESRPRFEALHHIPNYCFARMIGLHDTFLWIFFPALFRDSPKADPIARTVIGADQFRHWSENVVFPAVHEAIGDNGILQHMPATFDVAKAQSAAGREGAATGAGGTEPGSDRETAGRPNPPPRSRGLHHSIQPRHLRALWSGMMARAAQHPAYEGLRLYMGSKGIKTSHMGPDLTTVLDTWLHQWDVAIEPAFIDEDETYLDVARQITPTATAPEQGHVLLWRKCCLSSLVGRRRGFHQSQARANAGAGAARDRAFTVNRYSWQGIQAAGGLTVASGPASRELAAGLVYSQYYNTAKAVFDAAKHFPFESKVLETMALDPSYLVDERRSTKGLHASQEVVVRGYRLSKKRCLAGLAHRVDEHGGYVPDHAFTYGVRAEDRLSLRLLRRIASLQRQGQAQNPPDPPDPPRTEGQGQPFFAVPSGDMAAFLFYSINRYCFLFESIKSAVGPKYSLSETVTMAVLIRALRHSCGSGIIERESVLARDRWTGHETVTRRSGRVEKVEVEREGLALTAMAEKHGFGWWGPDKFDWDATRFLEEVEGRMNVGNRLLRRQYSRQWRAIRDIRDITFRLHQAERWLSSFQVARSGRLTALWLEYLHTMVLEEFRSDVWAEVHRSLEWSTSQDFSDRARLSHPPGQPPPFCHDGLATLFTDHAEGIGNTRPHYITGNRLRFPDVLQLFSNLFETAQGHIPLGERRGWSAKPYLIAVRESRRMITNALGPGAEEVWFLQLYYLTLATNWVLPWPSETRLVASTKEDRKKGLHRRLMFAPVVHVADDEVAIWRSPPAVPVGDATNDLTVREGLASAVAALGSARAAGWSASALANNFHKADIARGLRLGRAVDPLRQGRIYPVVETGTPCSLRLSSKIRDRTARELHAIFSQLAGTAKETARGGQDRDYQDSLARVIGQMEGRTRVITTDLPAGARNTQALHPTPGEGRQGSVSSAGSRRGSITSGTSSFVAPQRLRADVRQQQKQRANERKRMRLARQGVFRQSPLGRDGTPREVRGEQRHEEHQEGEEEEEEYGDGVRERATDRTVKDIERGSW